MFDDSYTQLEERSSVSLSYECPVLLHNIHVWCNDMAAGARTCRDMNQLTWELNNCFQGKNKLVSHIFFLSGIWIKERDIYVSFSVARLDWKSEK